jgi:beta-galactosidase
MENDKFPIVIGKEDEIPLRKIEINSQTTQTFDENNREITVTATLHPVNTSYDELEWSVVTDTGIKANIAKIESFGDQAKVTALGDGDFRVRCTSMNGTDKPKLISELEFKAVGLGTAYKDPYTFISAGLYDYSKGDLGNGNDRGVATSRDGETQVGFREIDFGTLGSDLITIPIFALSSEEYSLQIWEGMPDEEDSERLADVIYQKESTWNTYQEESYQLSKRLKGITSICFVLDQKVHIKGFSFQEINRSFKKNLATDRDQIYGDTYKIKANSVEGIGNNVSLVFEDLNFTEHGANKLIVYGRSSIDKNTIHVRFSSENSESNQVVEFNQSEGYEERVFNLDKVTGIQNVNFIFLPGSNFDFGWFRFEK